MPDNINKNKPYVMIVTTACGGGHLQAANALKGQLLKEDPQATIVEIDIFNNWLGKHFGAFATQRWNAPLRKGHNILSLGYSYVGIPIADHLFFIPFFIHALITFLKLPLTRIIDTQPVATSALTLALLIANKVKGQSLKIEKILTEIPTKRAIHFFHPLKLLPKFLKNLIELYAVEPWPDEPNFWIRHTGLNPSQIKSMVPPLREAFFDEHLKALPRTITVTLSSDEEKQDVLATAPIHSWITEESPLSLTIHCQEELHLTTIMLGSQPHTKTIQQYLLKIRSLVQDHPEKKFFVFVLCHHRINGWKEIKSYWKEEQNRGLNFYPILLSVQKEKTVAKLLAISHCTITRSGGLTSMELLQVNQRNAWIHTDIMRDNRPILSKMPPWEIGNAEILIEKIGAKVINPNLIEFEESLSRRGATFEYPLCSSRSFEREEKEDSLKILP